MSFAPSMTANMACDRSSNASPVDDTSLFGPPSRATYTWRKAAFAKHKALVTSRPKCRMPVQLASNHMPSFPEEELNTSEPQKGTDIPAHSQKRSDAEEISQQFTKIPKIQTQRPSYPSLHFHRDSISSHASNSSSSSPTTTVSLTESSNLTETPITSPDTPASSQSLSSFTLAHATHPFDKPDTLRQPPAPLTLQRPSTGHKKPRNLKGLAVNTSSASAFGRALNTANLPLQRTQDSNMISAPASPAFVKPLNQPRRKGSSLGLSKLSIVPPASQSPPVQEIGEVPPTPSLVRPHALRHFPSSPSLPLASPSAPPEGGMQLPPLALRRTVNVGFAEAPQERDEDEPNFDVPQSAEPKPQAYPDGPICIYDPHVYLFYEPPVDVATRFDVIVNVASEVTNPFEKKPETSDDARTEASSPTTPKPAEASVDLSSRPEYVHIPWEHNTDIVPDLYDLVKLIDERVQDGKKVLIHCQLGVSRSASLIVAYGLYKNPSMTVQEAYDAVKRRSKWISPNMSLIMQLQEFRTELIKQSAGMPKRGMSHRHRGSKSNVPTLNSMKSTESPSRTSQDRSRDSQESGPRSAPLPPDDDSEKTLRIGTGRDAVTPGPSSAPSGFAWPTDPPRSVPVAAQPPPRKVSLPTESTSQSPFSRVPNSGVSSISTPSLSSPQSQSSEGSSQFSAHQVHPPSAPFRDTPLSKSGPPAGLKPLNLPINHVARFQNSAFGPAKDSPRAAEFAMNPAQPPTPDETFGLTSPRVTNFQSLHNSLHPSPMQPSALSNPPTRPIEEQRPSETPQVPQRHSPKVKPIMPPDNLAGFAGLSLDSRSHHEQQPSLDSLTSPRATEFAMAGIGPPRSMQNDDGFGLTSPRENLSFAQQMALPHGRPKAPPRVPSARERAFASLHSPSSSISQPRPQDPHLAVPAANDDGDASKRRSIRSKLGMSTSSSYDLRSEYVLAAQARELISNPSPRPGDERRESFHSAMTSQDDMDALMSPRVTEFTRNPFADALGLGVEENQQSSVVGGERPKEEEEKDPRSPVQKAGTSPIVRNIADVFP